MKAFEFRLQTKLNVCLLQENQAKEELSIRMSRCQEIEESLNYAIERNLELERQMRLIMQGKGNVQYMLLCKDYLPKIKNEINFKRQELIKAEERAEKARQELLEKAKESKVMKKLREKEWLSYLQEVQKQEQKQIDETAINKHFRKNKAN